MASRLNNFTPEELQSVLDNSTGYVNALRNLGIGGNSSKKTLLKLIEKYNLSVDKLEQNREKAIEKGRKTNSLDLSDILIQNSTYENISRLKIRLVNEGLKENKCEICGINTWNNKPLVLQLHHINGIHNDHRLENLQLLCPNCHSQTDNYAGANNK